MYKENKICMVIPCYNEENHIKKVICTIPFFVDLILVIDDGSIDNTYEEVNSIKDNRVFLIKHERNIGVGAAIITGHKKSLELNCDISVVMGGDGQMDPYYLSILIDFL